MTADMMASGEGASGGIWRRFAGLRRDRLVLLLGAVVVLVVTASSVVQILSSREQTLRHAEAQLDGTVRVLAAQTQHLFEAVQLAQMDLEDGLRAAGGIDRTTLAALGGSNEFHALFARKRDAIAGVGDFMLVSLDGKLLNSSSYWPVPAVDASDRDYVKAFQTDTRLDAFVSKPVRSKVNGSWTAFVARRIAGANGQSTGLVVAALHLADFESFYQQLALPGQASINLFRSDGTMLARFPRVDRAIGQSAADRPVFATVLAKGVGGVVRQDSMVDGVERLIAVRRVDNFPLAVTTAIPTRTALAVWRRDATQMALVTFVTDVIVAAAALLALLQLRRADRQARRDRITGAGNRLRFGEDLEAAFRASERAREPLALLLVNIDRFKEVNDAFGHSAGDALLGAAAARMRDVLAATDMLARIGGDEFAVVQAAGTRLPDALALAERLVRAFKSPIETNGRELFVSVSIGIAMPSDVTGDPEALFRDADQALRHAKAESRGRYEVFDAVLAEAARTRKALERDLRRALDLEQLHLVFQPLLDLRTGEVAACEALLRWRHPQHGEVSPARFIPIAEETGLITAIGRWVLDRACAEAARWHAAKVAVNLSPVQFRSGTVVADIEAALARSGLEPGRLEVEITESVEIVENQAVGEALRRIKALGVRISLDDFGTGYSSMSYLRSFPFDKIKIDRSFVADMQRSPGAAAVVRATLQLARDLDMHTTAEGVETVEQLAGLRDLGCSEVQGYLIAKPMPARDVPRFISQLRADLPTAA